MYQRETTPQRRMTIKICMRKWAYVGVTASSCSSRLFCCCENKTCSARRWCWICLQKRHKRGCTGEIAISPRKYTAKKIHVDDRERAWNSELSIFFSVSPFCSFPFHLAFIIFSLFSICFALSSRLRTCVCHVAETSNLSCTESCHPAVSYMHTFFWAIYFNLMKGKREPYLVARFLFRKGHKCRTWKYWKCEKLKFM